MLQTWRGFEGKRTKVQLNHWISSLRESPKMNILQYWKCGEKHFFSSQIALFYYFSLEFGILVNLDMAGWWLWANWGEGGNWTPPTPTLLPPPHPTTPTSKPTTLMPTQCHLGEQFTEQLIFLPFISCPCPFQNISASLYHSLQDSNVAAFEAFCSVYQCIRY